MLNNQVFLYSTFSMITLFICWSWTTAIEQHEQIINNNHSGNNSIKSKVKIDVYYETLCPDSIQFLLHQLVTNYDRIKEKVDLHMYPFGKAQVNFFVNIFYTPFKSYFFQIGYQFFESGNSYEFYCQHGPKECRGNMIHCCVLDQNSHDISFPFIKCMEKELYGLRRPDINVVSQKVSEFSKIYLLKIT